MRRNLLGSRVWMSIFAALLACPLAAGAQTPTSTPTPSPSPTAGGGAKRVWTIEEIQAEQAKGQPHSPARMCQGGRFAPCICWQDVSRLAKYRPAVEECDGNAAIVLLGKYTGVYSAVVRDSENRDRWPAEGVNQCTPYERDVLGLNKCSVFKVQDSIPVGRGANAMMVHCLGASGYSKLFSRVTRMTVKLRDIPGSDDDPVLRWCLRSPKKPLN